MLRRPREGEIVDFAATPRQFKNPLLREEIGYSRMLSEVYEPRENDDEGEAHAASHSG